MTKTSFTDNINKYEQELLDKIDELNLFKSKLTESEEKYRKLFEHAGFAIVLLDAETGRRVDFNRMAHESMGYTREEYIELSTKDVESAENQEEIFRHFKRIIETGKDLFETQHVAKDKSIRDILVSAVPVKIGGKYFIQNIRIDITEQKRTEKALQEAHHKLGEKVKKRTAELEKANIDLEIKTKSLEEINAALRVLLKKRDEDRSEIEEKILTNIKELVEPYIFKLRQNNLEKGQVILLDILESNFKDIGSSFINKLSGKYINLSPAEIQIASLVKHGKSSKEIATLLNLSRKTIDSHRNSIRNKLGIKNQKTNLRTYLSSLN